MATRRRQYDSWSHDGGELRVGFVAAAALAGVALLIGALIVPDAWALIAIPGALLLAAALVVLLVLAWRGARARAIVQAASAERVVAVVLAAVAAGAAVAVIAVALARDDVAPAFLADVLWPLVVLIFGLLAVAALLLLRRPAAAGLRVDPAEADTLGAAGTSTASAAGPVRTSSTTRESSSRRAPPCSAISRCLPSRRSRSPASCTAR